MTGSQPGPCPQDKALGVKTVPCPYLTPILPHAQPLKPGDTSATARCHTSLAQSPPTVAKHKARPTCPRTLARPPDGPTLGARRQADPGGPTRGTEGGAPEPPMTGALLQPGLGEGLPTQAVPAAAESDLTREGTQDGAPQSTVWDHGEGCPAGCRDFCRPRQRVRAMARTWGPTDSRRSLCPANGFLKGGRVPGTGRTGDSDRSCSSARSPASPGVCAARQAPACPPARRRACTPPSRRLPKDSCGAVSEFSLPCAPRPAPQAPRSRTPPHHAPSLLPGVQPGPARGKAVTKRLLTEFMST